MSTYHDMYEKKSPIDSLLTVKINPTSFTDWEDAYWFAKCIYAVDDPANDKKVIDGFDIAFYMGLNIEADREKYLDATRITAKLYFQYQMYSLASNKLLMLISGEDNIPVWVNLYFAITQIYTNLSLVAEDPEYYLFPYLDAAVSADEIVQRNSIYIDFLNLLIDKKGYDDLELLALDAVFDKACNYGLNTELILLHFKDAYGIEKDIPIIEKTENEPAQAAVDEEAQKTIIEQNIIIADLQKRVEELERTISERLDQIMAGMQSSDNETAELEIVQDPLVVEAESSIEEAENQIETIEAQLPEKPVDATYLFRPGQKILVYGGQQSRQDKLVLHAKKRFGLGEKYFEFVLDYDKIKSHAARIQPYSEKYAGILIGESPHMTSGTEDYSSLVVRLETEEGFPYTVRATDEGGKLKMTKTSFGTALWKLINHLQSQY